MTPLQPPMLIRPHQLPVTMIPLQPPVMMTPFQPPTLMTPHLPTLTIPLQPPMLTTPVQPPTLITPLQLSMSTIHTMAIIHAYDLDRAPHMNEKQLLFVHMSVEYAVIAAIYILK